MVNSLMAQLFSATSLRALVWVSILLVSSVGAARADTQVSDSINIAVLDWRTALLGTDQAKREFSAIRASLSQDEQEIRSLAEQAKQLQEKLKAQSETLSADEKRQLSKDIQEKAEEYQFLGQRLQKEQRQRQEVYIRGVRPQLDDAVRQVIEAKKIDLLLDRQAVTFVHKKLDITQDVISQLNKMQSAEQ